MIDIDQLVAILRLIPLCIAFWTAYKSRRILPALIAVFYVAAIVFGQSFMRWNYATAVFSTPLAYLVSWYMIKEIRKDNLGRLK